MAIVALVGRPNVGKSSLFNRIIGQRRSIEAAEAGTTRDRVYGQIVHKGSSITLVDVAGILAEQNNEVDASIQEQIQLAETEADCFLFIVDAIEGLHDQDQAVAQRLRKLKKPVIVVANKADSSKTAAQIYEFSRLGFGEPHPTSAIHNSGIEDVLDVLKRTLPHHKAIKEKQSLVRVALIGRPNVGKSTLLNQYAGTNRSIVSATPGTTRDTVDIVMPFKEIEVQFVDTAGIRRAGKVEVGVEKFSVLRTIRAIEESDVTIVLIDASVGPSAGDARIAGMATEYGKGVILAVNKWDVIRNQPSEISHQRIKISDQLAVNIKQRTTVLKKRTSSAFQAPSPQSGEGKYGKIYSTTPSPLRGEGQGEVDETGDDDVLQRQFLAKMQLQFAFMPWAPVVFISALTGLRTPKLLEQIRRVHAIRRVQLSDEILGSVKHAAEHGHTHMPLIYSITQSGTEPPSFELIVNRPETWHFSSIRFIENLVREAESFNGTPVRIVLKSKH